MFASLIYLDRYRHEGTRTYSQHADYTEAREKYRPNSKRAQFDLPVFEVPRKQLKIYTANPSIELAATYLTEDKTLFGTSAKRAINLTSPCFKIRGKPLRGGHRTHRSATAD